MEQSRTFFVTSVCWGRRSVFQVDANVELFLQVLFEQRELARSAIHEFVVMPEHFHALLTPTSKVSLEKLMQYIKGGFSFRYGKGKSAKVQIWQQGFTNHHVQSAVDYAKHREYIRMNPVRRGLVLEPEEFRWSSANPRFECDPMPQGLKPVAKNAAISPA